MNLAVVAAVFPVIFLGELPDKTMFASLVMATRGRPFAVWLGATAAFAVHVVIAITVGVLLLDILPHRAVELAVALTFFAGAGFALYDGLRGGDDREQADPPQATLRRRRSAITTFVVIFLAEWGDLTQVLTVNLAARYHSPWSVGTGALLGLAAVAGIAVAGGQGLLRFVNVSVVRVITAIVLIILGCYAGWAALGEQPLGERLPEVREGSLGWAESLMLGGHERPQPGHFGQSLSRRGKWIIGVICAGALVIFAAVGVWSGLHQGSYDQSRNGCINLSVVSSTGGAVIHACGSKARRSAGPPTPTPTASPGRPGPSASWRGSAPDRLLGRAANPGRAAVQEGRQLRRRRPASPGAATGTGGPGPTSHTGPSRPLFPGACAINGQNTRQDARCVGKWMITMINSPRRAGTTVRATARRRPGARGPPRGGRGLAPRKQCGPRRASCATWPVSWRWRESNPRPSAHHQGFSERILRRFSRPRQSCRQAADGPSRC